MKASILLVISIIALMLVSCNKFSNDRHVYLEFKTFDSFNIKNRDLTVSIYGFDMSVSGPPATLIAQKKFSASAVPFKESMRVPGNAADLIKYIDRKENALYYIVVEWDSDGNGKIEPGDISLDYSKSMDILLKSNLRQTFYLKTIPDYASIE